MWLRFNATVARRHSLACSGIVMPIRVQLMANSQAAKHNKIFSGLVAESNSTLGGDTMAGIHRRTRDIIDVDLNPAPKKKSRQSSMKSSAEDDGRVVTMTSAQADRVIRAEVEAMLARGESLKRFMCPWVQAALVVCCPAIATFLPKKAETLFDKFVPIIDMETTLELTKIFELLPGELVISSDGITVNG